MTDDFGVRLFWAYCLAVGVIAAILVYVVTR